MLLAALILAFWPFASADVQERPRHARNNEFNRALGVDCSHCHVPDQWRDATKPAFAIAKNMTEMVVAINEQLADMGFVTCVTCHGGQVKPSRQPADAFDARLAAWPAELADASETQKITMTAYSAALGVECSHCHSRDWKARDKDPIRTVAMMMPLFDVFPKYMPKGARTQCYMCHKGSTLPQ